jgi:hypothetical protein
MLESKQNAWHVPLTSALEIQFAAGNLAYKRSLKYQMYFNWFSKNFAADLLNSIKGAGWQPIESKPS